MHICPCTSKHHLFLSLRERIKAPLFSSHWWNTRSSWHQLYLQWGPLWGHLLMSLLKPPSRPQCWLSLPSPQLILHSTVVLIHQLSKCQSPRKWTGWSESKWQMPIQHALRMQCWWPSLGALWTQHIGKCIPGQAFLGPASARHWSMMSIFSTCISPMDITLWPKANAKHRLTASLISWLRLNSLWGSWGQDPLMIHQWQNYVNMAVM